MKTIIFVANNYIGNDIKTLWETAPSEVTWLLRRRSLLTLVIKYFSWSNLLKAHKVMQQVSVFPLFLIILLQLRWPIIESKCSLVGYFVHLLAYNMWEYLSLTATKRCRVSFTILLQLLLTNVSPNVHRFVMWIRWVSSAFKMNRSAGNVV